MSFTDTYAHEVIQSRRTRAQRATFWAKIISFVLMITIAATLRSEPQLRLALMSAGMDAVMTITGRKATASPQPLADINQTSTPDSGASLQQLLQEASEQQKHNLAQQPAQPSHPRDAIRVNRHGFGQGNGVEFQRVQPDSK